MQTGVEAVAQRLEILLLHKDVVCGVRPSLITEQTSAELVGVCLGVFRVRSSSMTFVCTETDVKTAARHVDTADADKENRCSTY